MKNIVYRPAEKRYIGRKQINGHTITVYARTQKDCSQKLNAQIKELKKAMFDELHPHHQYTVLEFWDKWYKENKEPFIADTTRSDFEILKRKLAPIFQIKLSRLTKEKILEFLSTLEANRTREKLTLQLKSMLSVAVKERKLKFNPFDTIIVKKVKRKPKPAFTYDQQEAILRELKKYDFEPIALTYLTTGMRKRELDFKNIENQIDENNILTCINLKGRDREVRYKKIKLSSAMVKIIKDNAETFHKYTTRLFADKFKAMLDALQIEGSVVTCRHTFATNCFYLGKDSLIISREMGHSTSQITKDNYIDIDYNLSKEKIFKLYNNLYNTD